MIKIENLEKKILEETPKFLIIKIEIPNLY